MLLKIITFVLTCHLQFVKPQDEFEGFQSDNSSENEIDTSTDYSLLWNTLEFEKFYDSFVNSNLSYYDRENRRNEFIPFNSLTFQEGGAADNKFKSKIRDKNKVSSQNKFEWWKKQKVKDKKKKKNKNKTKYSSSSIRRTTSTSIRTTTRSSTTTTTTRRSVTTWFPASSSKPSKKATSGYFSRPLDHQKPIKHVWWGGDKTGGDNYNCLADLVCKWNYLSRWSGQRQYTEWDKSR